MIVHDGLRQIRTLAIHIMCNHVDPACPANGADQKPSDRIDMIVHDGRAQTQMPLLSIMCHHVDPVKHPHLPLPRSHEEPSATM
jgi:hypothetical protein